MRERPFFRQWNQSWYVQIGKKQVRLCKGKENEEQAYELYYKLMAASDRQEPQEQAWPLDAKFNHLAEVFLADTKLTKSEHTFKGHQRALKSFCLRYGRKRIIDIIAYDVTHWLNSHPEWSESTKRSGVISFKACLNWGLDQGLLSGLPLKINLKKVPRHRQTERDHYLTPQERQKIYEAIKDQPFRQFVFALEHTGARPISEIGSVTARHVDLDAGAWVFTKAEHKTGRKTGKKRIIYLSKPMLALTKQLMILYPEGPLFRNTEGNAWRRGSISDRFLKLAAQLNIPGLCAYLYRHAYLTDGLEKGIPDATLAELAGNSPTILNRYYSKLSQKTEHLRKAAWKAAPSAGTRSAK